MVRWKVVLNTEVAEHTEKKTGEVAAVSVNKPEIKRIKKLNAETLSAQRRAGRDAVPTDLLSG